MPSQRLLDLHQAGRDAATARLDNLPSQWERAQIGPELARRYARDAQVVIDANNREAELAAFLEGYNEVARHYEQFVADQQSLLDQVTIAADFAHRHNFDHIKFNQLIVQGLIPGAKKVGENRRGSWIITEAAGLKGLEAYRRRTEKKAEPAE
jgi:hypothetical protein